MEITPEIQALIDGAVEKATEGLKTKNKELVDREKKAKTAADEAETAREEAARDAAEKSGDIETLKASLEKKHAAEVKKLTEANGAYETRLSELLIDNAVKTALTTYGVPPELARGATLLMKEGVKMVNGEAVNADGLPIADHLEAWSKSAEAKHYTAAPNNTGAGATGSTANAGRWSKAPRNSAEQLQWDRDIEANPAEMNAIADRLGRPDLKV